MKPLLQHPGYPALSLSVLQISGPDALLKQQPRDQLAADERALVRAQQRAAVLDRNAGARLAHPLDEVRDLARQQIRLVVLLLADLVLDVLEHLLVFHSNLLFLIFDDSVSI